MFMSLDEAIQNSYDACASNDENKLGRCLDAGLGIDDKHTWIIHIKMGASFRPIYPHGGANPPTGPTEMARE